MTPEPNTTPIRGRLVPYRDDVINTDELRFWEANPRVYAAVRGVPEWSQSDPMHRQELILKCMEKQESTQSVMDGLKRHKGQQEPLIVDLRGNIVIEGNSRLAALMMLARDDNPGEWGAAICRCYNDLSEEERFALLSEMHVIGKTEWTPYAKASTYWRQHHELDWDFRTIASVNRTTVTYVRSQLATIDLMNDENELNERKYSWYNILTSNRDIKRRFEENSQFRSRVLEVVRDASPHANDAVARSSTSFRDALVKLIKKDRPFRKFCSGRMTLQEASDEARMSGLSAKLRKVRDLLRQVDSSDFSNIPNSELNDAKNTFRHLQKDVSTIAQFFANNSRDA